MLLLFSVVVVQCNGMFDTSDRKISVRVLAATSTSSSLSTVKGLNGIEAKPHRVRRCRPARQSHKDSVRKATVVTVEQFSRKTIHPAMRAQLHLPVLDQSSGTV